MYAFLCSLWPLLLAGLIGWLLCGLMARSYLRGRNLSGAAARPPVERVVEKLVEKVIEKPVPDTAGLAARDAQIANLRALLGNVEQMRQEQVAERDTRLQMLLQEPVIDLAAARRAGIAVKGADDLEVIEGIGPKIAALLHGAGIHSFARLSLTATSRIQEILDAAGPTFRVANPGTWAEQAGLCAHNRWTEFKALTDELVAGVRVAKTPDAGKAS